MRIIQANLKGRKPKLQERETHQGADVVDLMARLRASLEGKGAPASTPARTKRAPGAPASTPARTKRAPGAPAAKARGKTAARSAAKGKKKSPARRRAGHAA